jgi:hypothetical protein
VADVESDTAVDAESDTMVDAGVVDTEVDEVSDVVADAVSDGSGRRGRRRRGGVDDVRRTNIRVVVLGRIFRQISAANTFEVGPGKLMLARDPGWSLEVTIRARDRRRDRISRP